MSDLFVCFCFCVAAAILFGQGDPSNAGLLMIVAGLYNLAYEVRRVADRKS